MVLNVTNFTLYKISIKTLYKIQIPHLILPITIGGGTLIRPDIQIKNFVSVSIKTLFRVGKRVSKETG